MNTHTQSSLGDKDTVQELAEKTLQTLSPKGSHQYSRDLSRLVLAISKSGQLYRPHGYSQEAYSEALQDTFIYLCRNFDTYDPARGRLMTWLNTKLKFSLKNAQIRAMKYRSRNRSLSTSSIGDDEAKRRLEESISLEQSPLLSEQIKRIIREDPDNIFKQRHIRGRPDANFRAIALKLADGYSRREIAAEYNMQEQTLYSFFSRSCKAFRGDIHKYLTQRES